MGDYSSFYVNKNILKEKKELEQLCQLVRIVSDGHLLSKSERDKLVRRGLADRQYGYNFITKDGIKVLHLLGLISH